MYKALIAGSERGLSLEDNLRAFGELGFAPHVAGGSGKREQGVRVMGQDLSMPVLISPTGVQAVHPDGEVADRREEPVGGLPDAGQRCPEVALDVDRERLERRDVEHARLIREPAVREPAGEVEEQEPALAASF